MNCRLNKKKVLNQFNKAAYSYDSVAGMQRMIVDELCRLMPTSFSADSKLIDLGCGTGYALQQLTGLFPDLSLHGVDIAPKMLEVANEAASQVSYFAADIEHLPFNDHSFDIVFSSSAIQWCDLHRVGSEIKRIIRPDGQIYISSFLEGTLDNWRALWMDDNAQRQQHFANYQQVVDTFNNLGFTDIEIEQKTLEQTFTSFESAVSSIKQLGAGNATRSRETGLMSKTNYFSIKAAINTIIQEQGQLILPYKVVYITATAGQN
ncbi:MAG: methyltransferase domain-containing protein [Arenicella sp.]